MCPGLTTQELIFSCGKVCPGLTTQELIFPRGKVCPGFTTQELIFPRGKVCPGLTTQELIFPDVGCAFGFNNSKVNILTKCSIPKYWLETGFNNSDTLGFSNSRIDWV